MYYSIVNVKCKERQPIISAYKYKLDISLYKVWIDAYAFIMKSALHMFIQHSKHSTFQCHLTTKCYTASYHIAI